MQLHQFDARNDHDATFYVTSPFQLISAFEARSYFGVKRPLLIVLVEFKATTTNRRQLLHLTKELGWEDHSVIYLKRDQKSKYLSQIRLLSMMTKLKRQSLFLGEFSSFSRALIGLNKWEEVFLLDDGSATLFEQLRFRRDTPGGLSRRLWDFSRDMRFRVLGYPIGSEKDVKFFSAIATKQVGRNLLIRHNFEHTRSRFQAKCKLASEDSVLFVGNDLSLPSCDYQKIFRRASRLAEGRRGYYAMHRGEEQTSVLSNLSQFGFYPFSPEYPIEIEMLQLNLQPKIIIGTISTALITLKLLFPSIPVYAIDIRGLWQNTEELDFLYSNFRDQLINVVSL